MPQIFKVIPLSPVLREVRVSGAEMGWIPERDVPPNFAVAEFASVGLAVVADVGREAGGGAEAGNREILGFLAL